MEVLRLRKMTLKSVINVGRFYNLSVQNVIDMGNIGGLVALYFNLSKISYTDDVLDILGITKDLRIEKPGKIESLDMQQKYRSDALNNYYKDFSEIEKMNLSNSKNAQRKRKSNRSISAINSCSKGKMASINRGKGSKL